MEHRWNTRTNTDIKVTLYHNRIPVIVCQANNIGLGGLFVKAGPIAYPKDTVLEADFQLAGDNCQNKFHARTCVVYSAENGLGLMFIKPDITLLKSIRELLLNNNQRKKPIERLYSEPAVS